MPDHVYRVIDLVGTSERSIDHAIQCALERANRTIKHIRWFEVINTRGQVENGRIAHYQVELKVGFTIEDTA